MLDHKSKAILIRLAWLGLILLTITVEFLPAQNYRLEKAVVDQGGRTSQSANYKVINAVGQPCPVSIIQSTNYVVSAGYLVGKTKMTGIDEDKNAAESIPTDFELYQNYPNPFNPITQIYYHLPRSMHVTLKIYNLQGHEIRTLVDEFQSAGNQSVVWDGLDDLDKKVTSGLYFYHISAGDFNATKKMIVVQ